MTKIIAVTACPSGVAHTYMAAEALERGAGQSAWQIRVTNEEKDCVWDSGKTE